MADPRPSISQAPVRFHIDYPEEDEQHGKAVELGSLSHKDGASDGSISLKMNSLADDQFGVSTEELEQLIIDMKVQAVKQFGGVEAYAHALKTNTKTGLSADEVTAQGTTYQARLAHFGDNVHKKRPLKTYWELCKEILADPLLILLCVAGVVSVGLGSAVHPSEGWYEGVSILLAVLMVTIVGATNNYGQQKSFAEMEAESEKQIELVTVVRSGELLQVHPEKVLVGDIVKLVAGRFIPADGLLVGKSVIMVNESRMTGETIDIRKDAEDPFLRSGTEVRNGECFMLTIAVGPRSAYGRILASLSEEPEPTPLQIKLERMATLIGYFGVTIAVGTLIVLLAYWGHDIRSNSKSVGNSELQDLLEIALVCVTIVVVSIPEGLPLAVTLALAYSMKKMKFDNIMIRKLDACETMGNVSTICSDKTGTLTQNRMKVVNSWFTGVQYDSGVISRTELDRSAHLKHILTEGILLNSQAWVSREDEDKSVPPEDWNWKEGNATETALMSLLVKSDMDLRGQRDLYQKYKAVAKVFPFDSVQKRSSVIVDQTAAELIKNNAPAPLHAPASMSGRKVRQYFKGAAEVMVDNCSAVLEADGTIHDLTDREKKGLLSMVRRLTRRGLRALAFTMCELTEPELEKLTRVLAGDDESAPNGQPQGPKLSDPTGRRNILLGWVGIQDPLRPETYKAVRTCQRAGVVVRMVTGDALDTAKFIARECGILTSDKHVAMIGSDFRALMQPGREAEAEAIIPKLRVLARSLPQDKETLVQWLKDHGEVVAATGDGTNDAPALNCANVGLAMNIAGTAVCKAAARIWILDDSLQSISLSILWGRSVFDSIRRFLQFQLTVNVVACMLSFIGAITNYPLPLTTVQLLWVNLIMDSLGALALATDDPDPSVLKRRPYQLKASIISPVMLRNIIIQSVVQLAILFYLLYAADTIFPELGGENWKKRVHFTLIFNTFVFLQLFNMISSRSVNTEVNVFKGILVNKYFSAIWVICAGMQGLMVEVFGPFASTSGQTWQMWLVAIGLGAIALPFGILSRVTQTCVPLDFTGGEVIPTDISFDGAKLDDHAYSEKRIDLSRMGSRARSNSRGNMDDFLPLAENQAALSDEVTLDEHGQIKGLASTQASASGSWVARKSEDKVHVPQTINENGSTVLNNATSGRSSLNNLQAASGSASAPAAAGQPAAGAGNGLGSARRENPNLPAPQLRASASAKRTSQ